MATKGFRYEGYIILASLLWGTSFVSVKIGVEEIDPFFYSILRFLFGSLFLIVVVLAAKSYEPRLFKDRIIWGIALVNAVAYNFQHVGISMTTATNAALLIDINAVFVAILAVFILGERLNYRIGVGLALGIAGVVVVTTGGDLSTILSGSFLGNMLVFFSGILWAVYIVYQKKVLMREVNVLMITAVVMILTTIFLVPMSLPLASDFSITDLGMASVVYTGIFCSGLAFILYNAGLRKVGATISSIILLLEIVFAVFFAYLILSEVPTMPVIVGGSLIVLAIAAIALWNNNQVRDSEPEVD
jgi:drug/metabolite transporter (DMT)-like permease